MNLAPKILNFLHNPGLEQVPESAKIISGLTKKKKQPRTETRIDGVRVPSLSLLFPCHCRAKGWWCPHANPPPLPPQMQKNNPNRKQVQWISAKMFYLPKLYYEMTESPLDADIPMAFAFTQVSPIIADGETHATIHALTCPIALANFSVPYFLYKSFPYGCQHRPPTNSRGVFEWVESE